MEIFLLLIIIRRQQQGHYPVIGLHCYIQSSYSWELHDYALVVLQFYIIFTIQFC